MGPPISLQFVRARLICAEHFQPALMSAMRTCGSPRSIKSAATHRKIQSVLSPKTKVLAQEGAVGGRSLTQQRGLDSRITGRKGIPWAIFLADPMPPSRKARRPVCPTSLPDPARSQVGEGTCTGKMTRVS